MAGNSQLFHLPPQQQQGLQNSTLNFIEKYGLLAPVAPEFPFEHLRQLIICHRKKQNYFDEKTG